MNPNRPRDPRETRQKSLVFFLRVSMGIAVLLSALAVLLPEPRARDLGVATVGLLIAVPLVRIAWLAVRWALKRDYRFAATAALLASIVAIAELAGAL